MFFSKRLLRRDASLYFGDDYFTDVLIDESVKKTETSGTWYYMVGDSSKIDGNTEVVTPDQMVDADTKEIGI